MSPCGAAPLTSLRTAGANLKIGDSSPLREGHRHIDPPTVPTKNQKLNQAKCEEPGPRDRGPAIIADYGFGVYRTVYIGLPSLLVFSCRITSPVVDEGINEPAWARNSSHDLGRDYTLHCLGSLALLSRRPSCFPDRRVNPVSSPDALRDG